MKKSYALILSLAFAASAVTAQNTSVSQMEKLGRGVVAVPTSKTSANGRLVTWRLLGTDDLSTTTFDVLRNGNVIKSGLKVTNYSDALGNASSKYSIVTRVNGEVVETTEAVNAWDKTWMKLPLDRPATGAASGGTYSPNDCSVGDVDGDGEYEIFVKWDPSTSKDNSQGDITDNVYIDCYKLDGTKLWRIDLGRNIRAGAHYTQFQVYDYDGDGKAEMICKTAPGSLDGTGVYVNQATDNATIKAASNTKDWAAAGGGRINGGHEYLTVFEGLTGKAINTIPYYPNRNAKATLSEAAGTYNWALPDGKNDTGSYGNRGERFLAGTAYIDGVDNNASAIFSRGYYGYAYIWAVSFKDGKLTPRWLSSHENGSYYKLTTWDAEGNATSKTYSGFSPTSGSGSGTMYQNGNHNMSVVDADGDGYDDIIWGSAALKHDGTLRYGTGFGHGDAMHVGQMRGGSNSYQVFQVHESGSFGWDLHDAATGKILYSAAGSKDNGRGVAAQLSPKTYDWWFSSGNDRQQRSAATGGVATTANGSTNFRIYWDGSVQDALLDGNVITKYDDASQNFNTLVNFSASGQPSSTCNGTKNTPNLVADIFGDWREEIILHYVSDAETYLGIYSTNIATSYAVPTLMHDHTYRTAISWQNTAYNQPPHLGYNLAWAMRPHFKSEARTVTVTENEPFTFVAEYANAKSVLFKGSILPDETTILASMPYGFTRKNSTVSKTMTITGTPDQVGDYRFVVSMTGYSGEVYSDTIVVSVTSADGISPTTTTEGTVGTEVYDAYGRRLPAKDAANLPRGIYLIREKTAGSTVTRKIAVE